MTSISSSGCDASRIEKPYGIVTRREQQIAYLMLDDKRNATPIMLYFHFALNQTGKALDFSPADLENRYRISRDRWRSAFSKLVEKGYLVPEKGKKYRYTFYSLPEKYKTITLIDESADCPANEDTHNIEHQEQAASTAPEAIPTDRGIPTDRDRVSAPTGIGYPRREGEGIPADRDSNNKDNKDIINNNKGFADISSNINNHPEDKELIEELNTLKSDMWEAYGHLENFPFKMLDIESRTHSNRAHYDIKEHISMLKKLGEDMIKKRRQRNSFARNDYLRAVSATMPKDSLKNAKINLILDRYIAEHKEFPFGLCREKYGIWVNGWNEERQEPNVIVALHLLPLEVLMKQKHNIDGIPKEYYIRKKKTD